MFAKLGDILLCLKQIAACAIGRCLPHAKHVFHFGTRWEYLIGCMTRMIHVFLFGRRAKGWNDRTFCLDGWMWMELGEVTSFIGMMKHTKL